MLSSALHAPPGHRAPYRCMTLAGAIVAATAMLTALTACGRSDAADVPADTAERAGTPVAAIELVRRDLSRQLATSATVQPRARIRLASRTTGTLDAVHVEEGDAVAAGDVLAELDMAEANAELAQAQAQQAQAQQEYARAAELRTQQLISAADYEQHATALNVAESRRRLWQTRVAFGQIVAPRDAVVTARHFEPGEAVETHDTLFELASLDELVVRLGVSELDVVHMQPGQAVPIRLDAMPELELEGTVRRIFPQADVTSRLITVEVALPERAAEHGVRPGYLARVQLAIDQREDVIAVPASAIGEDGDERYVYVIDDDRLHRRVIERGATRGQWTQVTHGLEAGEIILATNPIDMSDGEAVRIVGWRG